MVRPTTKPASQVGQTLFEEYSNSIGMKLRLIPAGEFTMGTPLSETVRGEGETQHDVRITKAFYLGKYEVTRGEFRKFVSATDYKTDAEKDGKGSYWIPSDEKAPGPQKSELIWRHPGFEQTDEHPVVNVSWNDAVEFCKWLSRKERKMFPTEVGSMPRSRILAVFPVNYRESFVCELSDLAAGATLSACLEVAGF